MIIPPVEPPLIAAPLRLRRISFAALKPSAWLVAGDASVVLHELCRWGVALNQIRIMPLPQRRSEHSADVLAIPPSGSSPMVSPRSQPYVCRAGRLYFPADSELYPPISDPEIEERLGYKIAAVHPTQGWITLSSEGCPTAMNLIASPAPQSADWSLAVAGVVSELRIASVEPLEPPGFELLLQAMKDDISADDPGELPPLPHEGFGKRALDRARLNAMQWLSKMLPPGQSGTSGSSALQKFSAWLQNKASALGADLSQARFKELARLMSLLESDPDAGLRFALPLTDTASGRGVSMPGARLTKHGTDFSIGGVRGSGPVDVWNTPADAQRQLRSKYLELATRELSLGRYRRAAYIFAELLGNYTSAANALMQGKFWREAAALYQEKLKDNRTAASCLAKGGLIVEAIKIYESLKDFEKVGDLFAVIDRPDEAGSAYSSAVQRLLAGNDYLEAARVLDVKLLKTDEALAALDQGWPDSPQAERCLVAAFQLLGRTNRHDEAKKRLEKMKADPTYKATATMITSTLITVAKGYPTGTIRTLAADLVRVIAGRRLADEAESYEASQLLKSVQRLTTDDRLLVRDIARYTDNRSSAPLIRRAPVNTPPSLKSNTILLKSPEIVREFLLPKHVSWMGAQSMKGGFFAIGRDDDTIVVARSNWTGRTQAVSLSIHSSSEPTLRISSNDQVAIAYQMLLRSHPAPRNMPASGEMDSVSVGVPEYLGDSPLVAVSISDEVVWSLSLPPVDGALLLQTHHQSGKLLYSGELDCSMAENPETWWMLAREKQAVFANGKQLHVIQPGTTARPPIQLRDSVTGLSAAPPLTTFRVVTTHAEGATIVWPWDGLTRHFAAELIDPAACLARDGLVVAIGRNGGRSYRLEGRELSAPVHFEFDAAPLCAILPADDYQSVAAIKADGRVSILRVS